MISIQHFQKEQSCSTSELGIQFFKNRLLVFNILKSNQPNVIDLRVKTFVEIFLVTLHFIFSVKTHQQIDAMHVTFTVKLTRFQN